MFVPSPVHVIRPLRRLVDAVDAATGPRRAASALTLLVVGLLLTGCSNRTSDRDIVLLGVDDARSLVGEAARPADTAPVAAWIDPRTASDWLTERIPGALHVPVGRMRDRAAELRAYETLVIYGRGFKDPVAYAGAKVLGEIGVADVRVLEGGLTAWLNAGRPVASGSPMPDEGRPATPPAG